MEEKEKFLTVVYEITDFDEFKRVNPLEYNHHGLQAIGASCGDLMAELYKIEHGDADE